MVMHWHMEHKGPSPFITVRAMLRRPNRSWKYDVAALYIKNTGLWEIIGEHDLYFKLVFPCDNDPGDYYKALLNPNMGMKVDFHDAMYLGTATVSLVLIENCSLMGYDGVMVPVYTTYSITEETEEDLVDA